jgi:hypothetical protein
MPFSLACDLSGGKFSVLTFCNVYFYFICSYLLNYFQAPGCVPWGIINTYLNDYLAADQGMSVEGATFFILIFGIGNFAGTGIGGIGRYGCFVLISFLHIRA